MMHPDFVRLSATLKKRPLIMGVLNVTPDSFSDGGLYMDPDLALAQARRMETEGADIIDLGGESTRPGAPSISVEEELRRVLPVARAIGRDLPGLAWSIDTQKAEVARICLGEGACLVNDVSSLSSDPAMLAVAAASKAGISLMHRLQAPAQSPWSADEKSHYGMGGVSAAVAEFLVARRQACLQAGIVADRLWFDPGLGFGKTVADNLKLLKELPQLLALGQPVLVGASRKSFIGAVSGNLPVEERLEGTLAACVAAVLAGASILRVHDVQAVVRAVKVTRAIQLA